MTTKSTDVAALRAAIKAAAPDQIDLAFAGLFTPGHADRWLPASNELLGPKGPSVLSKKLADHTYSGQTLDDVLDYGAASVILHCGDGWSYFSRGLAALASGSLEVAQHLLYYAELRAARTVLQRCGVFVFDGNPFYVDKKGKTHSLVPSLASAATHQATWNVLDAWIAVAAPTFLGQQLRLSGRPLADWTSASAAPVLIDATVADLLRKWGVDLTLFLGDRSLRNQVSYDPNRLTRAPLGHSPALVASAFREAWSMLEPSGSTSFDTFDGYLVREIFEEHFLARNPFKNLTSPSFSSEIDVMVSSVLGGPSPALSSNFYGPDKGATPTIIRLASTDPSDASIDLAQRILGMLGRSMILLRLATGSASDLLVKSGVHKSEVDAWATDMLEIRGICPPDGTPRVYSDLWEDVVLHLEELELLDSLGAVSDMPDIFAVAGGLNSLTIFERVPAWAVA